MPEAALSVVASSARDELLAELRALCARFPLPQASWHVDVPPIRACHDDFTRALALAGGEPEVLDLVAAIVDGAAELAFREPTAPALTEAYERLRALPRPSGQHPFLDEIVPALEAMEALLAALSHVPGVAWRMAPATRPAA